MQCLPFVLTFRAGWRDVLQRTALPGYEQLVWRERAALDARAAVLVLLQADFWRLLLWTTVWLLGLHVMAWRQDLAREPLDAGILLSLLWVLPATARLRRRCIASLLGPHWPAD